MTIFSWSNKADKLSETPLNNIFVQKDTKLRPKLSSGFDNIPNIVLRNLPENLIFKYGIPIHAKVATTKNTFQMKSFMEKPKYLDLITLLFIS